MVNVKQSNVVEYSHGNVILNFSTVQSNTLPAESFYTLIFEDDAINMNQEEFANLKGIFAKLLGTED